MNYVISLKHTHKGDKYITLWRPNNAGYCYSQDQAGKYKEIIDGYHNNETNSVPFKCDKLDGLFIDSDIIVDNKVKKCMPNCKQVWNMLNLKMTKTGLAIIK